MRLVKIMKRGGEDLYEYKKALRKAKEAIETICELSEDMEEKYSERGGMYRDDEDWDYEEERKHHRR